MGEGWGDMGFCNPMPGSCKAPPTSMRFFHAFCRNRGTLIIDNCYCCREIERKFKQWSVLKCHLLKKEEENESTVEVITGHKVLITLERFMKANKMKKTIILPNECLFRNQCSYIFVKGLIQGFDPLFPNNHIFERSLSAVFSACKVTLATYMDHYFYITVY